MARAWLARQLLAGNPVIEEPECSSVPVEFAQLEEICVRSLRGRVLHCSEPLLVNDLGTFPGVLGTTTVRSEDHEAAGGDIQVKVWVPSAVKAITVAVSSGVHRTASQPRPERTSTFLIPALR